MALHQCTMKTIAETIGLDEALLRGRKDISSRIKLKKAQGRAQIHATQYEMAQKQPVMAIWFGKQHLEQSDRADVTSGGQSVADFMALMGSKGK